MSDSTITPHICPTLTYKDAKKAIDWLCNTFGFNRHLIVPSENDGIAHAQLTLGDGMIMLSDESSHEFFRDSFFTPNELGGKMTSSVYVIVPDIKGHYENTCAKGAKIIVELTAQDYGGSSYTCTDIDGHVWSFGDYDPKAPTES